MVLRKETNESGFLKFIRKFIGIFFRWETDEPGFLKFSRKTLVLYESFFTTRESIVSLF